MLEGSKNSLYSALRWSEQYTKTDMVYLARGGAWSVGGSIANTFIAFASVLAFANLLPKEVYGTYQYFLAMVDLFGVFVLAGIDTALGRSVARGLDGSWKDALMAKIQWGFVGALGSFVLGLYYFINSNALLGWGFLIAALALPFWEAPGIYETYLQGKRRFDLINIGSVIFQFFAALVLIGALFFTDNVLILIALYLFTYGLLRAAGLVLVLRLEPPNQLKDPDMLAYGKKLTLVSVMGNVASSVDKIVIWQMLGPVSVATYTFAQSIPGRANGFIKTINRLAFPKLAAQESGTLQQTLLHKILITAGLGAVAAGAYAFLAPYLFTWFLPQYVEAIPYTMVVGLLMILQPFSLLSSAFTAQAKEREIAIWSIATPIIRFSLFITFIPLWGLWGAVWALVGAKTAESALLVVLFYRGTEKTPTA